MSLSALLDEATGGLDAGDDGAAPVARTGRPDRDDGRGGPQAAAVGACGRIRAVLREQGGSARWRWTWRPAPRGTPVGRFASAARVRLRQCKRRADARFNEYPGGIGLGLPIARRVIEQAGGRIWSSEQAAASRRRHRPAAPEGVPLVKKPLVAIVDDDSAFSSTSERSSRCAGTRPAPTRAATRCSRRFARAIRPTSCCST